MRANEEPGPIDPRRDPAVPQEAPPADDPTAATWRHPVASATQAAPIDGRTPGHDRVHPDAETRVVDAARRDAVVDADRRDAGATPVGMSRQEVVARQKERFGGMRLGSAFFGWLTATGTAVLLTALVAGAGAVVGLGDGTTPDQLAQDAAQDPASIGVVGAVLVLVVLFVAYLAGGYVAGRMARFSGAKQGLGVWLWAVTIAVVLAIVSAIAGARWNVLGSLDAFPRLPIGEGEVTTIGVVTLVLTLVVSLAGAVIGGLAGMRFHRRVDREGLGR